MRGVRPPSWKNGLPLGRRALVGSREEAVARRTRQTTPAATRAVAVEGDDSVDARGPGLLASRSRPNQQPTLKPEGVLPTLPHVARPAGAPAPALVHDVPAQSTRRPGSVSVEAGVTATSLDLWRADAYEARRLQTARPRREVERIPAHDRRALPPRRCSRPAPPSISRRNRLRLWGGRASPAPSLSGRRCRGRRHRRPDRRVRPDRVPRRRAAHEPERRRLPLRPGGVRERRAGGGRVPATRRLRRARHAGEGAAAGADRTSLRASRPCLPHHGCLQYVHAIHDRFFRDAGYNAFADANHVVVLSPQATRWRG